MLARLHQQPHVVNAVCRNGKLLIDLDKDQTVAPLVTFLVQQGTQIEEIRRPKASLEDVFLSLVEDEK